MRAIGYLTVCATIGGILALSTPFTERRSIKTWAPNVVVAAPKPVATVINAPQSPAAAVAMVDAVKPSHVARNRSWGEANTLLRRNRPRLEPIPRKPVRCRSKPKRRRGRLRDQIRTRLGNARESRAPRRDCHGLNGRWRKSPRSLFDLPESRSSSGWPKEDTENTGSALDQSSREALSLKRPTSDEVGVSEHCWSKRDTAATAIDV